MRWQCSRFRDSSARSSFSITSIIGRQISFIKNTSQHYHQALVDYFHIGHNLTSASTRFFIDVAYSPLRSATGAVATIQHIHRAVSSCLRLVLVHTKMHGQEDINQLDQFAFSPLSSMSLISEVINVITNALDRHAIQWQVYR